MFSKLIAVFFLWLSVFILTILIMIFGWGLEVKSWLWIIGGNFLQLFLAGCMQGVLAELKKE